MPQMMPMEWMMLYMMFLITFLLFNIMNYFMHTTTSKSSITKNYININPLNWKW
uniref:ATP synthase complex subunit 8 n=1 Tax=Parrhinotermes sp. C MW-2019 TaxID=2510820 RepID=A0A411ASX7_9NEOP|nr:ATP synthase F0 subunit 8 [Parrhinotermes sp. C MW-2019]